MVSVDFVEFAFETMNKLIVYGGHLIRMVSKSLLDKLLLLSIESLSLLLDNQVFKRIAVSHSGVLMISAAICLNKLDYINNLEVYVLRENNNVRYN